jgi:thiamine-phosphate diphosphorylase/hydroxyethylthiazole kinase
MIRRAGGIHLPNLPQLLHGSPSPKHLKGLDGVAVISDVVGSPEPENAARKLRAVLDSYHRARKDQAGLHAVFGFNLTGNTGYSKRNEKELLEAAASLIAVVRESTPLAHQVGRITIRTAFID